MSPPGRPDEDDLPAPSEDDPPGVVVWAIIGCALVLAYIAALALLQPTA